MQQASPLTSPCAQSIAVCRRHFFRQPVRGLRPSADASCSSRDSAAVSHELLICTNRTCKRQGSIELAKFGRDLALPNVLVRETGCLGQCGSGPNVMLLPGGIAFSRVKGGAELSLLLDAYCDVTLDQAVLEATRLRLEGNAAARSGQLEKAVQLYTQGIDLRPAHGCHLLLSNRSGVRLQLGDKQGAVEDAWQAQEVAPAAFTTATVRLVDALYALEQYNEAAEQLEVAVLRCPGFRDMPEYELLRRGVDEKLRGQVGVSQG